MTDYYTCDDCGGYRLSCGCDEKRDDERRAYWTEEAQRRREAIECVKKLRSVGGFVSPPALAMNEAFDLVLHMAERGVAEAVRFSKRP